MSTTTVATNSISSVLLSAPYQLNMWLGLFILITGDISIIGNIIVYRSRVFRNRAYSVYLFWEAITLVFFFNFVLLTRILQKGFQIPVMNRYDTVCKLRQFASEYTNQVALTFFIFATIDRLLSTQRSSALRNWSNRVHLAHKLVPASAFFWLLFVSHRLVLYSTLNGRCQPQAGVYAVYDNYSELFVSAICPPIILLVFAYLLMQSVRGVIQRRVVPSGSIPLTRSKKGSVLRIIDAQLTSTLLIQLLVAIPAFLPYAIELIYSSFTKNWNKSPLRSARETVIVETIRLLSYLFFSSRFYVSMITNHGFRKQIIRVFKIRRRSHSLQSTLTLGHTGNAASIQHSERNRSSTSV